MGELINLRQARKSKNRARKQQQAAENRVKFGRSKTERRKDDIEDERRNKTMDGKQLDTEPS